MPTLGSWKSALLLLVFFVCCLNPLVLGAQSQSDISPLDAPGMKKTTTTNAHEGTSAGVATSITPAATGRLYPSSGALLVGQGDGLQISVFETPEYDEHVRVSPDGNIEVSGLGTFRAESRTLQQIGSDVRLRLIDLGLLVDPKVTVSIFDYVSHGVAIQGEVRSPGIYPILGKRRLSDMLTAAGGSTELSDGTVTVQHQGSSTPIVFNLQRQSAEAEIVLPGDTISLPRAALVYVLGNVRRPGGFPLVRPTTLSQALALAQGLSPSAKDRNAYLFRSIVNAHPRDAMRINIHDVLRGHAVDLQLQADDILFIPNSSIKDVGKALAAAAPAYGTALLYVH